jgi:hypothetical protein
MSWKLPTQPCGLSSPRSQVKLTLRINVVNGWNRISVGFGLFVDPAEATATAAKAAA